MPFSKTASIYNSTRQKLQSKNRGLNKTDSSLALIVLEPNHEGLQYQSSDLGALTGLGRYFYEGARKSEYQAEYLGV